METSSALCVSAKESCANQRRSMKGAKHLPGAAQTCRRLTVWHGSIKLPAVWQKSCQKILLYLLWLPRTVSGPGSLLSWSCCPRLVLSLFYYIPTFDQVFDTKYVFTHMCIHMHVKAHMHTHTHILLFKYTIMHFPFTQAMIYFNLDLNRSSKFVLQVGKIWFGSYTKIWSVHYSSHKLIDC